jgi:putative membrane protein (TIGR04086 family)
MKWIQRFLSRRIRSSMLSGLVAAFAALFICSMSVNAALYFVDLPLWLFNALVYSCHLAAIYFGTAHIMMRRKKRPIFNGIRISVAYSLLIWLAAYFFSDRSFEWSGLLLIGLAIAFGIACAHWTSKPTRRGK